MRLYLPVVILLALFACNNKSLKDDKQDATSYELVQNWFQSGGQFELGQPTGIGVDSNDHIFVFHRAGRRWSTPFPDTPISNNTILEIDPKNGTVIQAWGKGLFIMPHGLTVDKDNNIWVTDVGLHQVFKFSHDGKLLLTLGVAKVPANDSAHFNLPTDVAIAADGSVFVSDGYGNSRVVKFSQEGKYIKAWGSYGKNPGEFIIPHGLALANDTIYVADRQNNRIQLFDTSGKFLSEIKNDVVVEQVPSVAINNTGMLLAIDYDPQLKKDSTAKGSTVLVFNHLNTIDHHFGATGSAERTTCWFHDLAVDKNGNIYVGDIYGSRLLKFKAVK